MSLEVTQRTAPPADLEANFQRAEAARRAGDFAAALEGYLNILFRRLVSFRGAPATPSLTAADLVVLERAADLAVLFGHDQGANNLLAGMASALESAENFFAADYTLVKQAHLALNFGRLCDARQLLLAMSPRIGNIECITFTEAGLDAWESSCYWKDADTADRTVIFSRLYLVMGWLLASLGQYLEAMSALARGLRFTLANAPDLAKRAATPLRLTITTALLEQGDLEGAQNVLNELGPALDRQRQPGSYVRFLELHGKIKMLQGDFGGALLKYVEVLERCQSSAFTRAALTAMLNLSDALIFLNNTSVAQQILLAVKTQAAELDDPYVVARADCLLALTMARSASFAGNSAVVPSVLEMRSPSSHRRSPDPTFQSTPEIPEAQSYLSRFEDLSMEFYWHLNNADLAMASLLSSHLRESFGKSDSKLIHARLLALEGAAAYYRGDLEDAELHLSESIPLLRDMGLAPDLWHVQRILSWCWTRLGFSAVRRQKLIDANKDLLTSMTQSLPAGYQSIFLLNKWTDEEVFIAGEIDQLVLLKSRMATSSMVLRPWLRWLLTKRIYALLLYLENHRNSLAKDGEAANSGGTSLLRFLWQHPRDRATISLFVLPDRVLVVYAAGIKLDFEVAAISRITVRETVRNWHVQVNHFSLGRGDQGVQVSQKDLLGAEYLDELITGSRNLTPLHSAVPQNSLEATTIAEQLASQLLLPSIIKNLPPRIRALTIVPHDSLLGFPFAAITNEGNYLLERFDLALDFGLFGPGRVKQSLPRRKALFVGISKGTAQFPALPGVLPEVGELEKWSAKRGLPYQTLTNEAATKSAILEHLNDSILLHVACHGVFRSDQPDASGLVLSPGPEQVEILSLSDLSSLELSALRHVSLSSCSSADNFILPGRWIIGLPETLRRAGVQSVLACLWEVNDRFAKSFATRFYEYLNTYPRDEALKKTQLDCLKKNHSGTRLRHLDNVEGIDTTNPFYWASYILCGDYRKLVL